jgi:hypothetical protein
MFRQYLIILFCLLLHTATAYGQKTVLKTDFEKIIDNLNCSVAKFYIERNQGEYQLAAYKDSLAIFTCNFEHLMVFIKERQPQMEINGYLAEYINSLKQSYDSLPTNSGLFNRTVELFKEDVLEQYESEEDYQEFKINTIEYLKVELRIDEIGESEMEEFEEDSTWSLSNMAAWQIVLLIGVIVFLLIVIAFFRWGKKYGDSSLLPIRNLPAKPKMPLPNRTITTPDTEAETPEDTPEPKPKSVITPKPKVEIPAENEQIEAQPEEETEGKPVIFYMPYPKIDGSFYQSARQNVFVAGLSIFKFEIKVVEYNLATFEILSSEDIITDIFINPEIINPVCKIEGTQKKIESTLKSGVTKIITVTPGTVQLKNSHWRLKQKAVIRFEYE